MKAHSTSNIGNYSASITLDNLSQTQIDTLTDYGLRWLVQRVTSVDIALGIAKRVPGARGMKTVRDGRTRSDVAYTASTADKLKACFATLGDEEIGLFTPTAVSIGEKETETREPKYKREIAKCMEHESQTGDASAPVKLRSLPVWLATFAEYTGATHGDDGEYSVEMLQAVKVAIDDMIANS